MKKKKLVYLLLFSLLSVAFISPVPPAAGSEFPDIAGHWAGDYISSLSASGYINGYPDGKFRPDNPMTKAEFTTALMVCLGVTPDSNTAGSYSDTGKHWAKGYINAAVAKGVLIPSEDPNGLRPDDSVLRSQAAAMMVRALGKEPSNGALSFKDAATVEKSDYKGHIKTAYDLGLISGFPNGNFEPFTQMTRAQVCTVLTKFLKQSGNSASITTPPSTAPGGSITSIVIEDQTYNLSSTPVYFKINFSDVQANFITGGTESFSLNGNYSIKLDSSQDNPDVIINNNRYGVKSFSISNNKLSVVPSCRKFNRVSVGTYNYNSDYIKLYVKSASTDHYLSDLEIIDAHTVRLAGKSYDLDKDKITINAENDFYDIQKITLSATDTTPVLKATDPVVVDGMSMSDISAVFVGTTILNLNNLDELDFIIAGKRYALSEVQVDASGNFSVNSKIYSLDKVLMVGDDMQYEIKQVQLTKGKFIFYCDEGTEHNWVIVDDEYMDADDVKIIWNSTLYDMDDIMVVERNLIRIGSKQYEVDDNFKCRVDDKVYNIDEIEYDSDLRADVIELGSTSSSSLSNQPDDYVFYCNDRKYQEGLDDVEVKVGSKWLDFDDVFILDPTHFNYNGTEYDLIGARIRIDDADFEVEDALWHGRDETLDIYLEEI